MSAFSGRHEAKGPALPARSEIPGARGAGKARPPNSNGFTLMEVVIALAVLAVALMAVFQLNSGALTNHGYTKRLTVASFLARSKMVDLEQELYDKGFKADDDEQNGDFSGEGWPSYKWQAKILAPRTQGLSMEQLMGSLFGFPMGGGDEKGGAEGLGALFSQGASAAAGKGGAPGASGIAAAAAGPGAALAQGQFSQMVQQISQSVREVHLTVSWKDRGETERIDLVTHVVSLGPGSDRNGGANAATASAGTPPPAAQTTVWVRRDNGVRVPTPVPGPSGMTDPTDGTPLIPLEQWNATRAARGATRGGIPGLPPPPLSPPGGSRRSDLFDE